MGCVLLNPPHGGNRAARLHSGQRRIPFFPPSVWLKYSLHRHYRVWCFTEIEYVPNRRISQDCKGRASLVFIYSTSIIPCRRAHMSVVQVMARMCYKIWHPLWRTLITHLLADKKSLSLANIAALHQRREHTVDTYPVPAFLYLSDNKSLFPGHAKWHFSLWEHTALIPVMAEQLWQSDSMNQAAAPRGLCNQSGNVNQSRTAVFVLLLFVW